MRTDVEVREKKGHHQMDTFLGEGGQDMGIRVRREDTLYTEDSSNVIA